MPMSAASEEAVLKATRDLVMTVVRVDIVALDMLNQKIPNSRQTYKAKPGDTIEHKKRAPGGTRWWSALAYDSNNMLLYWNDFKASRGNTFTYIVPTGAQVNFGTWGPGPA
jgi:hypothetical protein